MVNKVQNKILSKRRFKSPRATFKTNSEVLIGSLGAGYRWEAMTNTCYTHDCQCRTAANEQKPVFCKAPGPLYMLRLSWRPLAQLILCYHPRNIKRAGKCTQEVGYTLMRNVVKVLDSSLGGSSHQLDIEEKTISSEDRDQIRSKKRKTQLFLCNTLGFRDGLS